MKLIFSILAVALISCGSSTSEAQITGTVTIDGVAPAPKESAIQIGPAGVFLGRANPTAANSGWSVGPDRELANVLVYFEADKPNRLKGVMPGKSLTITAQDGHFVPRVSGAMVGQELKFVNREQFLQNFHSRAVNNPTFNFGLRTNGEKAIKLEAPEALIVRSDFFVSTTAWIWCFPHPFFAVTGSDGKFVIDPSPADGEYEIVAWHESGQTQKKIVTIRDGKAIVDLAIKPPGPAPAENKSDDRRAPQHEACLSTLEDAKGRR